MSRVSLIIVAILTWVTGFSNAGAQQANNHSIDVPGYVYLGSMPSSHVKEFNETYYYASSTATEWLQAMVDCKYRFGVDGHLVSIESQEEQDFINTWLRGAGIYWTSGQYSASTHEWSWGGTYAVVDWTNWGPQEPALPETGTSRIALNHQNQTSAWWTNVENTQTLRHVCEYKSTGAPSTTTTTTTTTMPTPTTPDSDPINWICPEGYVGPIRHPNNCTAYYNCDANLHSRCLLLCLDGLYYNPRTEECDWPFNVPECRGGSPPPAPPPSISPAPAAANYLNRAMKKRDISRNDQWSP